MANSFAPVQYLRTDWNPDVWTAVDNQTDQRTSFALYMGAALTLPADKEKYQIGCILVHKANKQVYLNVGTDDIVNWQPFGPGTTGSFPTPYLPGQFLTNDGTNLFWSLIDASSIDLSTFTQTDVVNLLNLLLMNKGDILTHDGTNTVVLPVGADGEVLTADSAQIEGIKWGTGGGSGSGTDLAIPVTQTAHGLAVGDVIRSNGTDNQFTLAQANSPANSEALGIVTIVTDPNNFTYVSSAVQLSGAFVPVGTPGQAVWLDPAVAGGMTITEPVTVGQIKRGLGTIIASGATMYFDIAALAEEITPATNGGFSTINVTQFDDFVTFTEQNNSGDPDILISGNFGITDSSYSLINGEQDHPGIIRLDISGTGGGQTLWGFTNLSENAGDSGSSRNLSFDNDFDVTWLSRMNYNIAATFNNTWRMDASVDGINIDITETTVRASVNAAPVGITQPTPATGDWFKIRFSYSASSGVLTMYINNTVLFSGVVSITGSCNMRLENQSFSGGGDTLEVDTDYVLTNYTSIR